MDAIIAFLTGSGLTGLIALFFNAFKGGYEIRRNMFSVSAIADGNKGSWRRKIFLSMKANNEQVIVLSISGVSGRLLTDTGQIVKRIELTKTLIAHSPDWQFEIDYLPDRPETQKLGRVDIFVQAETCMNFRCYFSLIEFQHRNHASDSKLLGRTNKLKPKEG